MKRSSSVDVPDSGGECGAGCCCANRKRANVHETCPRIV